MAERSAEDLVKIAKECDHSFVFYRFPGEKIIHFCEGEERLSSNSWASERGFILYPFYPTSSTPAHFIPTDSCQSFFQNDLKIDSFKAVDRLQELMSDKKYEIQHITLLNQAIQSLKQGDFEKIVMARQIRHTKPRDFDPLKYYLRLCREYPNTFCYYATTKAAGTWVGASPELLFSQDKGCIQTTSLAGTISKNSEQKWREKETTEQEMVSTYIENIFENFNIPNYQKSDLAEMSMGKIAHLHNSYKAETELPVHVLQEFVASLHPTPAVSGLPKDQAIDFILTNEIDARTYYSGFVGTVDPTSATRLFVNLRCMEIKDNQLVVHAGGGITADSNATEEWKETCLKANTLLCLV